MLSRRATLSVLLALCALALVSPLAQVGARVPDATADIAVATVPCNADGSQRLHTDGVVEWYQHPDC